MRRLNGGIPRSKMVRIYNESCLNTLPRLSDESIDCVVTSPPYGGHIHNGFWILGGKGNPETRNVYDVHDDSVDIDKYNDLCVNLFTGLYRVLKNTGVVCWNVSYTKANPEGFIFALYEILTKTKFRIADVRIWKKPMAVTIDHPNRCTRNTEFVFILCKDVGFEDFYCAKELSSICEAQNGRKKYKALFTLFEAKNNDGHNDLNGATFSTEFAQECLKYYCPKGGLVYDPFMGTGTTANACRNMNLDCIGSEISAAQCDFAKKRIDDMFSKVELIKEQD